MRLKTRGTAHGGKNRAVQVLKKCRAFLSKEKTMIAGKRKMVKRNNRKSMTSYLITHNIQCVNKRGSRTKRKKFFQQKCLFSIDEKAIGKSK